MKKIIGIIGVVAVLFVAGCKPYDAPTFVEVAPNATAFVIPMDAGTENQDAFKSVELLEKRMVATKRIQIPHRWVQMGRKTFIGKYIDTVKVITVNRTPVTRIWDKSPNQGTSTKNDALEAESKDSLGISAGFTLTAYITPENASLFLFRYKGDDLASVVDTQVKNSIQSVFARECGKYELVALPLHKEEITQAIRDQVVPFYKEWGITIATDMGFVGGLEYDQKIQDAFDAVFTSQKAKERAEGERVAQEIINQKDKGIALNDAEIKKIGADAEAYAVLKKAEAIKQAGDIYVQSQFIDKWDGIMPKVTAGGGGLMNMINSDTIK